MYAKYHFEIKSMYIKIKTSSSHDGRKMQSNNSVSTSSSLSPSPSPSGSPLPPTIYDTIAVLLEPPQLYGAIQVLPEPPETLANYQISTKRKNSKSADRPQKRRKLHKKSKNAISTDSGEGTHIAETRYVEAASQCSAKGVRLDQNQETPSSALMNIPPAATPKPTLNCPQEHIDSTLSSAEPHQIRPFSTLPQPLELQKPPSVAASTCNPTFRNPRLTRSSCPSTKPADGPQSIDRPPSRPYRGSLGTVNLLQKTQIPRQPAPNKCAKECIEAARFCGLDPSTLTEKEHRLVRDHITYIEVTVYLNMRNEATSSSLRIRESASPGRNQRSVGI